MSDILIKNMELPKKGHFLFQISANGDVWVSDRNDEGTGIIIAKAIEVPPHGRCIDADEYADQWDYSCGSGMYDERFILKTINEAPTILEAST